MLFKMTRALRPLLALCASACASVASTPLTRGTQLAPAIAIVRRSAPYRDSGQVARKEGTLVIAVRQVDAPADRLEAVVVELRSATDSLMLRRPAQRNGVVVFDSVRAGTYVLKATRIGLQGMPLPAVVVEAGCRADIEFYLRVADVSDGPPPPPQTPGRATITYCKAR